MGFTAAQWIVLIGTMGTAVAGVLTAMAAYRKAKGETRTEVEIECLDRLKVARLEAESLADELHALRRKHA